jgi:hypothetical protein
LQIDWTKVDAISRPNIAWHEAEDEIAPQDYLKEKHHKDETAAEQKRLINCPCNGSFYTCET